MDLPDAPDAKRARVEEPALPAGILDEFMHQVLEREPSLYGPLTSLSRRTAGQREYIRRSPAFWDNLRRKYYGWKRPITRALDWVERLLREVDFATFLPLFVEQYDNKSAPPVPPFDLTLSTGGVCHVYYLSVDEFVRDSFVKEQRKLFPEALPRWEIDRGQTRPPTVLPHGHGAFMLFVLQNNLHWRVGISAVLADLWALQGGLNDSTEIFLCDKRGEISLRDATPDQLVVFAAGLVAKRWRPYLSLTPLKFNKSDHESHLRLVSKIAAGKQVSAANFLRFTVGDRFETRVADDIVDIVPLLYLPGDDGETSWHLHRKPHDVVSVSTNGAGAAAEARCVYVQEFAYDQEPGQLGVLTMNIYLKYVRVLGNGGDPSSALALEAPAYDELGVAAMGDLLKETVTIPSEESEADPGIIRLLSHLENQFNGDIPPWLPLLNAKAPITSLTLKPTDLNTCYALLYALSDVMTNLEQLQYEAGHVEQHARDAMPGVMRALFQCAQCADAPAAFVDPDAQRGYCADCAAHM